MKLSRFSIALMAVAISLLLVVQVYAQDTVMTCCVSNGGEIDRCKLGKSPRKSCTGNTFSVQFGLKTADDALNSRLNDAESRISAAETEIKLPFTSSRIDANAIAINANASADSTLRARVSANEGEIGPPGANSNIDINAGNIDTNEENIRKNYAEIIGGIDYDESGYSFTQIDKIQDEIGTPFSYSRIDQNEANAAANGVELVQGVIATGSGSIGHDSGNYYRTITYNPVSGDLIFRGELNHSLDPVPVPYDPFNTLANKQAMRDGLAGFWYCTVGDRIANSDIQQLLDFKPDDRTLAVEAGFDPNTMFENLCNVDDGCFAFKFENLYGGATQDLFPYGRLLVRRDSTPPGYEAIRALADLPLRGWFFGPKGTLSHGGTGEVYIALSAPDLVRLLSAQGWTEPDMPDGTDDVVVNLDKQVFNLLFKPNGESRGR